MSALLQQQQAEKSGVPVEEDGPAYGMRREILHTDDAEDLKAYIADLAEAINDDDDDDDENNSGDEWLQSADAAPGLRTASLARLRPELKELLIGCDGWLLAQFTTADHKRVLEIWRDWYICQGAPNTKSLAALKETVRAALDRDSRPKPRFRLGDGARARSERQLSIILRTRAGLPLPADGVAAKLTTEALQDVGVPRPWRISSDLLKRARLLKGRRLAAYNRNAQLVKGTIRTFEYDGSQFDVIEGDVRCLAYSSWWHTRVVLRRAADGPASATEDDVAWGWNHCSCPHGHGGNCSEISESTLACERRAFCSFADAALRRCRAVLHLLLAIKRGDMPAYQEKGRLELPARFVYQEVEQVPRKLLFASREKLYAQMVVASFPCASGTRHHSAFGPVGLPEEQFCFPRHRCRLEAAGERAVKGLRQAPCVRPVPMSALASVALPDAAAAGGGGDDVEM